MLLAIDIGNTNITLGAFRGDRLVWKKGTGYFSLRNLLVKKSSLSPFSSSLIASVVPRATKEVEAWVKQALHIKPLILGRDAVVPIRNLYRRPKEVGQDRLVNAYAAVRLYGYPAVVVDFGTAVTFDYINSQGAYEGGLILPGMGISLKALYENCALLPKVRLTKPEGLVGKTTQESMLSGIFYGYATMTDGILSQFKKMARGNLKIIFTGGHCELIAPFCSTKFKLDKDLTLKGLNLILQREKGDRLLFSQEPFGKEK